MDNAPKSVERPVHETMPVQVWADIDVGIATVVEYLNTIPGVRTHASCQGTIGEGGAAPYRPQVLVTWSDDATFERLASEFDMSDISESGHWCYVHPREADQVRFARMEPEHPFRRRENLQPFGDASEILKDWHQIRSACSTTFHHGTELPKIAQRFDIALCALLRDRAKQAQPEDSFRRICPKCEPEPRYVIQHCKEHGGHVSVEELREAFAGQAVRLGDDAEQALRPITVHDEAFHPGHPWRVITEIYGPDGKRLEGWENCRYCVDEDEATRFIASIGDESAHDQPQSVEIGPDGRAYIVGIPGVEHNCDAMGCPSAGAHTLKIVPIDKWAGQNV